MSDAQQEFNEPEDDDVEVDLSEKAEQQEVEVVENPV